MFGVWQKIKNFKMEKVLKAFVVIFCTISSSEQQQPSEYIYKSYQGSVTCTSQYPPWKPRSLSEIQNIVRFAIARNLTLKTVGSRHSLSDSMCTSGIPLNLTFISHFSYEPQTQRATAGAGMVLGDLLEKLHQYGRAISGHPMYSGITLGGAIANGVHGTGLKNPTTISQQLYSVQIVDGRGKVRKITKEHFDFKAFRVNLGLLGIVHEVELETIPQYKLHIRHFPISDSIIWNGSDFGKLAREHDHFQFWWFPTNKQIVLGVGNRAPVSQPGNCETRLVSNLPWLTSNALSTTLETFQLGGDDIGMFHLQNYAKLSLYKEVLGREPIFVEDDGESPCLHGMSIGYSHRMTSNRCHECAWDRAGNPLLNDDGNIVIPLNKLMPAMRTLSEIFDKQLAQFPLNGILVRFLSSGDAFMAMNEGSKEWVSIEWITVARWDRTQPRLGVAAYQAISQVLVEQYGGRPHWGKNGLYYTNPDIIRRSYPNLNRFIAVMTKYDPQELFINTFGERLKHGKKRYTVASNIAEHCALNDLCICKTNYDCGNSGSLDYTCGNFLGFPRYNVCLPGFIDQMRTSYTRPIIDMMAALDFNEDSVISKLKQYKELKNVFVGKKEKPTGRHESTVE